MARKKSFLEMLGFKAPKKSSDNVRYSSTRKKSSKIKKNTRKAGSDSVILSDDFEIISSSSSKKKPKKHRVLKAFLTVFLIGVISCCIIVGALFFYVFVMLDGTVEQNLDNLKLQYTSIIYAQNPDAEEGDEDEWIELKRLHGEENRLWVDLEDLPKSLEHAYISAEDKRFRDHEGVDWKRTIAAMGNLVFHYWDSEQGGSTITQQLIKNITDDNDTSIQRKMREIVRARYLESKYDKDVIMECYLNTIHLGNGVDGVEVAANYYFDKHASELTLTQAACLAAITKSPSTYNPYANPEANENRRNWVLDEMCNNGYITEEERDAAKEADLGLRDKPSTQLSSVTSIEEEYNSYFVDAVIDQVIEDLMDEKNYSKEYATESIYNGGYKIYTTCDVNVQNALEEVYTDEDNFAVVYGTKENGQSAMTVMDYEGHVVGIIGGRGEKEGDRVLNRAKSPRPTGSSIKPLSAYAPAIENNIITWASSRLDGPISKLENGQSVSNWPKNATGRYYGTVSIPYALQQSLNTIPVKLIQEMGIETSWQFVTERFEISSFVKSVEGKDLSDYTESSLGVGGSVYGISSYEFAAAYATFGNLGTYYSPTTYTKVLDQNDEVVLEYDDMGKRALSADTAEIMNELLQTVVKSGTGTAAAFGKWPIFAKTGTTTDTHDLWFAGGTPYYVATTWFGLDSNKEMNTSGRAALNLWKAVMVKIHEDLELKDFPISDACEYRAYCKSSGKLAKSGCSSVGYGYFKASDQNYCTHHSGDKLKAYDKPTLKNSSTTPAEVQKTTAANDESQTTTIAQNNETTPAEQQEPQAPATEQQTEAPATEAPATQAPPATEPPVQDEPEGPTAASQPAA